MTDIEQLRKEADDVKKALDALKNNVSLSESEKKNESEKLKSQAEATKQKIQSEIDALSDKTDDESKKKKEEAETLLTSFNETMSLYASILDSAETRPTTPETQDEEKSVWGKTKEWVGEQRDDVWDKDKRENEGGKNLLRTAGFVATGVGAVALTVKGVKKLWNRAFGKEDDDKKSSEKDNDKKEDKSDGKKPWRKRFLVGTAIAGGTVIGGVELYKNWNLVKSFFKEKLGLALGFDEALVKVENEVKNGKVDTEDFGTFRAHFEGMSYDETTQQICSFGESTKINKDKKAIEGMDVQFASREELFHAVNIVNFAKRELAGRGATENPFTRNSTSGDIDFNVSEGGNSGFMSANGSDFWTKALGLAGAGTGGLLGGYFLGVKGALVGGVGVGLAGYTLGSIIDNTSTMGRACNTIAKGVNLDKFVNYLNGLNVRKGKPQEKEPDEASPIHPYLNQVIDEIESELGPKQKRDLSVEYDENNPSEITIKSYHQTIKLKLEGNTAKKGENLDFTKITKISFLKYDNNDRGDGLDIDFPHTDEGIKEAIRTANLTNMLRSKFKNNGSIRYPFGYGRYSTPMTFDITNRLGGYHGTSLLEPETLEKKYPTIHKDLKKTPRFLGLPTLGSQFGTKSDQKKQHEQALNDSSEGSQYIKYLNQMGCGEYRWKKSSTN